MARRIHGGWRRVLLAVVSSALVALAGTGGVAAAHPNLGAALLSARQLPKGWAPGRSTIPVSGGCLGRALSPAGVRRTGLASATFITRAGDLPLLIEQVASFASPVSAYGRIVANLDSCKRFTGSAGDVVVHGAVGRISLPRLGTQSAAYAVSFTINGITSSEDVAVARDGAVVMDLSLADVSVSSGEFTTISRSALSRIARSLRPAVR